MKLTSSLISSFCFGGKFVAVIVKFRIAKLWMWYMPYGIGIFSIMMVNKARVPMMLRKNLYATGCTTRKWVNLLNSRRCIDVVKCRIVLVELVKYKEICLFLQLRFWDVGALRLRDDVDVFSDAKPLFRCLKISHRINWSIYQWIYLTWYANIICSVISASFLTKTKANFGGLSLAVESNVLFMKLTIDIFLQYCSTLPIIKSNESN